MTAVDMAVASEIDVALVTCRHLPEPDHDAELVEEALGAVGVAAAHLPWDDPGVDWSGSALAVVRSTWNYHDRIDAFLDWAERASESTSLWNPVEVIRWNVHKRYLARLASRGIRAVPTVYVERGDRSRSLAAILDEQGWRRAVVKPEVSAASARTHAVHRDEADDVEPLFRSLVADREMMVQPYVESVEGHGERAVTWIDGRLTHAVRKSPRLAGGDESVSDAVAFDADERSLAEAAVASVSSELLYARIDMARDEGGAPMIMELELVEPSLFLDRSSEALELFARAIAARLPRERDYR